MSNFGGKLWFSAGAAVYFPILGVDIFNTESFKKI